MITAVQSAITWAGHGAELKAYLAITGTDEDAALELWLAAATAAADRYLKNPFDGSEPISPAAIPPSVKLGVFEYVRQARGTLGANGVPFGLSSVSTGDLAEVYSQPSTGTVAAGDPLLAAAIHHFYGWRCRPLY